MTYVMMHINDAINTRERDHYKQMKKEKYMTETNEHKMIMNDGTRLSVVTRLTSASFL